MKTKEFEVWQRRNFWEISTITAKDSDEAHEKWAEGKVDGVRKEDAGEDNGEYEIEEKENDEN